MIYDDNRKEIAQTMNQKLCQHFTMRINKRYFTSLKLSFGILVNISDSIIYLKKTFNTALRTLRRTPFLVTYTKSQETNYNEIL